MYWRMMDGRSNPSPKTFAHRDDRGYAAIRRNHASLGVHLVGGPMADPFFPAVHHLSRRRFLVATGTTLFGLPAGGSQLAAAVKGQGGKAKSTVLFFLSGGASHIDTWDMKPSAPAEYRGPFQPISTTVPGIQCCEHLPLMAQQAHHLAIVRSVNGTVNTNDHHAGYYYNLTGHVPDPTFLSLGNNRTPMPDDWPYMGSVVASKRHDENPNLPAAITLPQKPSKLPYTRPGQFAGRLGVANDPLYVIGSREKPLEFQTPSLVLQKGMTAARMQSRRGLLNTVEHISNQADRIGAHSNWTTHQERAFSLLTGDQALRALDVSREPLSLRERYGGSVNGTSLLAARRLVEAGVPFVTVFWMEDEAIDKKCASAGGWDTHANNFTCLKEHLLPEFDQCFSAFLSDLSDRGLLDETLVLVTSEMGRTPKIGDPRSGGKSGAGRDHWTHCQTVLLAGGGIKGGQHYGSSDPRAEYPADKPITPAHVAKTVYKAMGIEDLSATDAQGRPYDLLQEGDALADLLG